VLVRRLVGGVSTCVFQQDGTTVACLSRTLEGDVSCAEELAVCLENCWPAEGFWSRHDL
jgi:hypothetical protein